MTNGPGWPACSTEERPWQPGDLAMVPRGRRAKIAGSYVATVAPDIVDEPTIGLSGSLALETVDAAAIEREAKLWRFDSDRSVQAASDVATALLDALETVSIDPGGDVARLVRSRCGRFIVSG